MECPVCGGLKFTEELLNDEVVFVTCDYCEGMGSVEEAKE